MRNFDLFEPRSIQEACAFLASDHTAKPIAGGTALLNLIKQGLILPQTLVNLSKIKAAGDITYDSDSGLRIGALATIYEIESSPLVRMHYPLLCQACHSVANIRIRHMATLGGNLAHADHQSDPPTALIALDASVELISNSGIRLIKLSEFLLDSYQTAINPGELILAIVVPPEPYGSTGVYLKFTTGSSEERPSVGIAALGRIVKGICHDLRLAVGAVSSTPLRARSAENIACNQTLSAELIQRIAAEAAGAVDPIEDSRGPVEFKLHLVRVLSARAITACARIDQGEISS